MDFSALDSNIFSRELLICSCCHLCDLHRALLRSSLREDRDEDIIFSKHLHHKKPQLPVWLVCISSICVETVQEYTMFLVAYYETIEGLCFQRHDDDFCSLDFFP